MRPVRRASTIARAGSPRRAGRVADISTPIIVAEVTSRRRSGRRGSAARAIENHEVARRNIEAIISAVATRTQPRSERTMLVTTRSTPIRFAAMKVRPTPSAPATPTADPARGAVTPAGDRRRRVERRQPAGRDALARRRPGRSRPGARSASLAVRGAGASIASLVDALDRLGNPRPGVALGRPARREAHAGEPLRVEAQRLQLLGESLRVGGRHEDPVDAVLDDVGVAGDVRGEHRGPGGERLGQDHAEALAGERRGAEQVRVVQARARARRR